MSPLVKGERRKRERESARGGEKIERENRRKERDT
jgi:hypothetical protein